MPRTTVPRAIAPATLRGSAYLLLAMLGWALTWPVNKMLLESMSPYWLAALRAGIAAGAALAIALPGGRLAVPPRADLPVVFSIALLHMVGFSILAVIGLQMVPVGRSVVLAYTTPLWVMPGAVLFLGEKLTPRRVAGVAIGLMGLVALFNPFAFDWRDRASLTGHAALLAAAFLWAASILHIRGHKWHSTPFQLVPWEMLLAALVLLGIALLSGHAFHVAWSPRVVLLLVVVGLFGSSLPYWAIAMAGRNLSATGVSMGLLGTPFIGVIAAMLSLGETPELSVWVALLLVIGGVALGAVPGRQPAIPP